MRQNISNNPLFHFQFALLNQKNHRFLFTSNLESFKIDYMSLKYFFTKRKISKKIIFLSKSEVIYDVLHVK